MEKLLKILQEELKIKKGDMLMTEIDKVEFISKVWNGLYNEYLNGSICGTISNNVTSIQYDADCFYMTRMDYNSYSIVICIVKHNNIILNLDNVKSINISISENNWIDFHFLNSEDNSDYSQGYTSIVVRG